MTLENYCEYIGELIGKDDLKTAIREIQKLLKNSPKLDEAIMQSAQYNDIMKQIRLGTISYEAAKQTKNQIRLGILNLLEEIQEQATQNGQILSEFEGLQSSGKVHIQYHKNVVKNSTIQAEGDIHIGDKYPS